LKVLADSPRGVTEDLLVLGHGFDSNMIAGLIRAGFVTAQRETIRAGDKTAEIIRLRITDAGRLSLEERTER
jgi:hypothetical protein